MPSLRPALPAVPIKFETDLMNERVAHDVQADRMDRRPQDAHLSVVVREPFTQDHVEPDSGNIEAVDVFVPIAQRIGITNHKGWHA